MLKTILSISGKPGLFKLISQAKNMLIVESLQTGKRQPAYAHEKIISLGDIAIFTDEEDVPLSEVLNAIKEKENKRRKVDYEKKSMGSSICCNDGNYCIWCTGCIGR